MEMSVKHLIKSEVNGFGWKINFYKIDAGQEIAGSGTTYIEDCYSIRYARNKDGHSPFYGQRFKMSDFEEAEKYFERMVNFGK